MEQFVVKGDPGTKVIVLGLGGWKSRHSDPWSIFVQKALDHF